MKTLTLQPKDSVFQYQGKSIHLKNFHKNLYTGTWSFDLYYPDGHLLGVPITTGTNVLKGNGTPFFKFVFMDTTTTDGDASLPANIKLYLLEE